MRFRLMLLVCGVVALAVGVSTASAGGGNSAAAHACQKGGWQNLVRSDGTSFANQDECVSYAAKGGTLKPKPPCTAGSENFSEFTAGTPGDQPTTFSGGTIDTAYGAAGFDPAGGVYPPLGGFTNNTIFTGDNVNSFKLTFTNAVNSVQLGAESNATSYQDTNLTLTGYDASNNVVSSQTKFEPAGNIGIVIALSVSGSNNNIKYFTIATDDPNNYGVVFSDIVWGCN